MESVVLSSDLGILAGQAMMSVAGIVVGTVTLFKLVF